MKARIPRPTYANVVATLALFIALGGTAIAASALSKNSVGPKQLKKNAVTTPKVKNKAITGAKIKPGTITGTQVNASTLGPVPVANLANSIAPPEAWHPAALENGWANPDALPVSAETVGFYKDREGTVHLKGFAKGGNKNKPVFHLPVGFRPAAGKVLLAPGVCLGCAGGVISAVTILGSGLTEPANEGAVVMAEATSIGFDGITFRAES